MGCGEAFRNEKIWTRPFTALTFCNFIIAMTMWLLNVEMVGFVCENYGVAEGVAGGAVACYVLSAALSRIFLGTKIDEWGAKRVLLAAFVINSVCPFAYLACSNILLLFVVRCFHGVAFGLASASAASAVVMVIPPSRKGEGVGYFSAAQAVATAVGPFLSIYAVNALGGLSEVFVFLGLICIATLVLVLTLKLPDAPKKAFTKNKGNRIKLDDYLQASLFPLLAILLLVYVGYAGLATFTTLYAAELGLSAYASFFFVVYALVMMVSRPKVGQYVDAHGPRRMVYLALLLVSSGLLLMSAERAICDLANQSIGGIALLFAAAMTGFGIGNVQSVIQSIVAINTPPEKLGKANSTYFLGMDIGSGVGPVAVGIAAPLIGYPAAFFGLGIIAIAALALYRVTPEYCG